MCCGAQVARENTAFLGSVVTPVHAAVVSEAEVSNATVLQYSAMEDHADWRYLDGETYVVQTRSLRMLRVRPC